MPVNLLTLAPETRAALAKLCGNMRDARSASISVTELPAGQEPKHLQRLRY